VKLRHRFGDHTSTIKYVLLDIPGCDEHGSLEITKNCQIAQLLTSVYIFVTSIGSYNLTTGYDCLKQLQKSSKGMITYVILYLQVNIIIAFNY